jgi:hypothetical protein
MAVTYTQSAITSAVGGSTLQSPTLDLSAGDNQLLVVGAGSGNSTAVDASGVTWDVATPEDLIAGPQATQNYMASSMWYLAGFTQADDTVTVTWESAPDSVTVYLSEFEGVDQTTPIGNTGNSTGSSGDASITLTGMVSGDMCADAICADDRNPVPGADQTERANVNSGGSYPQELSLSTQEGADGGVMTQTFGAAHAYTAMVIKQVAAVASNPKGVFNKIFTGPFGGPI